MDEVRGRIAQLTQQLESERLGRELAQRRFDALLAEHGRLKDAVVNGIAGNYIRERKARHRPDGQPSKLDKCPHDMAFYEDCEECLCDHLTKAIQAPWRDENP